MVELFFLGIIIGGLFGISLGTFIIFVLNFLELKTNRQIDV